MTVAASKTLLLLIDIQVAVHPPPDAPIKRSTPDFEKNIARLLAAFRSEPSSKIIHVAHHSSDPRSRLHPTKPDGIAFLPCAMPLPSETIVTKSASSAFIGTGLVEKIQALGVERLVIVGTTTEHCCASTTRMAADLNVVKHAYGVSGHQNPLPGRIVIVSDSTAVFDMVFESDGAWTGHNGKRFDANVVQEIALGALKEEFCDVETTDEVIAKLEEGAELDGWSNGAGTVST